MDTSEYGADPSSAEQQQEELKSSGEDSTTRLFPIFYKSSGGQEQNSGAGTLTSTSTRTGETGKLIRHGWILILVYCGVGSSDFPRSLCLV